MTDSVETGSLNPVMLDELLARPILARIATAGPGTNQPHVVPVWYWWDGESIWISAFRSTRKVKDLRKNPLCSIVIDEAQSGEDFQGVTFEGRTELVTEPLDLVQQTSTRIYARYVGDDRVMEDTYQSWVKDPENLLIRLTPERTYSWYSARKEQTEPG